MNRQFYRNLAQTIPFEVYRLQSSFAWRKFFDPRLTGVTSYWILTNPTTSTVLANGTSTVTTNSYAIAANVDAGTMAIQVVHPATPAIVEFMPDDYIMLRGLSSGSKGAEIRKIASIVSAAHGDSMIYLDAPTELPYQTTDTVTSLKVTASVTATQVSTGIIGALLRWGFLFAYTGGSTALEVVSENVDFTNCPLINPTNPQEFFDIYPGYVDQKLPLHSRYRGLQPMIDSVWEHIAERIRSSGNNPGYIMTLDQFKPAIHDGVAAQLAKQGRFPFPTQDPERTIERMVADAERSFALAMSNIQWYDEDGDLVKTDTETQRDIRSITFMV